MCADPEAKRRRIDPELVRKRKVGLHVFTRDLRLEDNNSLFHIATNEQLDELRFCFVFTPEQTVDNIQKGYFGVPSFAFMTRALKDLQTRVKKHTGRQLEIYYGTHAQVLEAIHKDTPLHAVSIAEDYTPYAKKREQDVREVLDRLKVRMHLVEDHCLTPCGLKDILSQQGTVYRVFTPFYNNASARKPAPTPLTYDVSSTLCIGTPTQPQHVHAKEYVFSVEEAARRFLSNANWTDLIKKHIATGTREYALRRLTEYNFQEYSHNRNHLDRTSTNLSAHFKFGLVSSREVCRAVSKNTKVPATERDAFIRQLYWRDFYMYITLHHPQVLQHMVSDSPNANFASQMEGIPWNSKDKDFERWSTGTTGVPFVDAAIREMNESGMMHNRGRMVVAMFLTKNLLIDWRRGERVFAQRLMDYDPCNNNGGWQWSSSTGADGAPYFRIMNPQSQMSKVDPTLAYVKRWVPELAGVPQSDVMKWEERKNHAAYVSKGTFKYPAPMVDLKASRVSAISVFKATIEKAKK